MSHVPLAQELTPAAVEEGITVMHGWLTRRSGRARSREDARAAFDNLLGVYATLSAWQARAAAEGPAPAPPPRPRTAKPRK